MFLNKTRIAFVLLIITSTSPIATMDWPGRNHNNNGSLDTLLRALGAEGVREWLTRQERRLSPEELALQQAAQARQRAQEETRQAQETTRQEQHRAEQERRRAEAANANANHERERRERIRQEDQNNQNNHARRLQQENVHHQNDLTAQREKARLERENQSETAKYEDKLARTREADLKKERLKEQKERNKQEAKAHAERLKRETEAEKAKAKAQAEKEKELLKERFKHRQENKQAYEEMDKAEHKRNKDTMRERIKAFKEAIFEFCDHPTRMKKVLITAGAATACTAGGVYFFKHFWPIVRKKVEEKLFVPALIDETSFGSKSFFGFWKKKKSVGPTLKDLIYYPELGRQVNRINHVLTNTRKNGGFYLNYLFYGEPGTGKTATARAIAKESGMDWAFMSGGNVQKLLKTGKAEERLKEVFKWAEKSKNGLILFIDEADAFLKDPNQAGMSEELYSVLNSFLNMTGTESQKICFILSTNHPHKLPKAVRDRVGPGQMIHFGLPPEEQRQLIAQHFVHKYIAKNKKLERNNLEDYITQTIAQKANDFSGRGLAQLVLAIEKAALAQDVPMLTKELIDDVVNFTVQQSVQENNFTTYA